MYYFSEIYHVDSFRHEAGIANSYYKLWKVGDEVPLESKYTTKNICFYINGFCVCEIVKLQHHLPNWSL